MSALAVAPALEYAALISKLYSSTAHVVGQDKARRRLAVLLAQQSLVAKGQAARSWGALVAGNTGVGKTMLVSTMCRACELPFSSQDATKFSETGFAGRDLPTMFVPLLEAAARVYDGRHDRQPFRTLATRRDTSVLSRPLEELEPILGIAETGVVLLDEFDKWLTKKDTPGRDVGRVLQGELLAMLSGTHEWIPSNDEDVQSGVWFKTHRVLIICCGAFVGLADRVRRRLKRDEISMADQGFWDLIEPEDFEAYGVIPELAGRQAVHVMLRGLNPSDLQRIVKQDGGIYEQFRSYFEAVGAKLEMSDNDLRSFANEASQLETGARALDFVFWSRMADALFRATQQGGGIAKWDEDGKQVVLE